MGGWRTKFQLRDLAEGQRLECTCRHCGHLHYLSKASLPGQEQKYIDEIQREQRCIARGCGGLVRIALVRLDEMSGFVGGLA